MATATLPENEQLLAWIQEWKPILSLQAWNIEIKRVPPSEIDGNAAEIWKNYEGKTATVKYNNCVPLEDLPQNYDWEHVTVHELVHLNMDVSAWDFVRDNPYAKRLYEQGIDDIARALVSLKRAGKTNESRGDSELTNGSGTGEVSDQVRA